MKKIVFTLKYPEGENTIKFATGVVHHASEFVSNVMMISQTGCRVDMKSILGVLSLQQGEGVRFQIEIEGADEDEAYLSINHYVKHYSAE